MSCGKSQTDFNFGFIPLGDFRLSDSNEINYIANFCPITAHKIVKRCNKPNYLGARLKVDSQLNLDEWKKELVGYWYTQLIDLLYFGFPLDFNLGCVSAENKNYCQVNGKWTTRLNPVRIKFL